MKKIVVICTANSCRSQMAEGFFRKYVSDKYEIFSAGIFKSYVNSKAIQVMKEIGIDISKHTSNNIDEYSDIEFDYIITVCDHANENCPYMRGDGFRFHYGFPDPANIIGTPKQVLDSFRKVRDMIDEYVLDFVENKLVKED